jgi:hypothetical protein
MNLFVYDEIAKVIYLHRARGGFVRVGLRGSRVHLGAGRSSC